MTMTTFPASQSIDHGFPRAYPDPLVARSLEGLRIIFGELPWRNFRILLWNGASIEPSERCQLDFTLTFKHPGALRRFLLAKSQLQLAEGYIFGEFELDGDLQAVFHLADFLTTRGIRFTDKVRLAGLSLSLPRGNFRTDWGGRDAALFGRPHSRQRDKQAITYHYDVSNEFYSLWLDPEMVYSCAYFLDRREDLATAQKRKLDYICKKLRLRPGDRLLDIGCGWGALLIHAAANYGVEAVGLTLSSKQANRALERIGRAGLQKHCQVHLIDYRDLGEIGTFDKVASVGMFEHVGRSQFRKYFSAVWRALKPGGVFLNHAISEPPREAGDGSPTLVNTYVFPDGEIVPLSEALSVAESLNFEIRDVENLREHYKLTLGHWIRAIEANHDAIVTVTSEEIYRIWRLYMAGCMTGFREGRLQIYQTLFSKPDDQGRSGLPLTRQDWYSDIDLK